MATVLPLKLLRSVGCPAAPITVQRALTPILFISLWFLEIINRVVPYLLNCTRFVLQRYFQNIYFIKCPFERILLEHRKNKFIATFFTRNSLEHVLSVPGQFLTSQFFKVIFFQSQLQRFDTFGCINSSLFKILSLHETLFSRWLLLFEHGRSVLGLGAFDASVVWEPPEASAGTRHCRPLTLSVLSVRVVPEKNRNSKNRQKILTSTWF